MARERKEWLKSTGGLLLIGFGVAMLYGDASIAIAWLKHAVSPNSEIPGVLYLLLAIGQALRLHGLNQQLAQEMMARTIASVWPLAPVMMGTLLLKGNSPEIGAKKNEEKDGRTVDFAGARSMSK